MSKVKSGTHKINLSEKISIGRDRVTALTGNTNINPDAAKLAEYTSSVTALQNAQAEVANAQIILNEKYAKQYDAEKEYEKQTTKMVNEINSLTNDETKLVTSGFPLSSTGSDESPSSISLPEHVIASMGPDSGEIAVNWRSVKGSHSYILEYCPDPAFPAGSTRSEHLGKITKTTIKGLDSGTKQWVRVQAIKGREKGPWSDPSLTMVS